MIPDALRGPVLGRLGFRLMAAVAIALTPLALLSYNQSQKFESEAQARWESALFGETLLAATPQLDAISRARGLAAATANAISSSTDKLSACTDIMKQLVSTEPTISFAGFIPPDGNMICASTGKPYNFAGDRSLLDLVANPRPLMSVNPKGPISGESVLIFTQPVISLTGQLIGFVSLSLPHRALERRPSLLLDPDKTLNEPLALVTFDGQGTALTAIYGIETIKERLPANRLLTDFVNQPPTTFLGRTPTGQARTFAVMPIVPGSLYVLGSWPASVASAAPLAGYLPLWGFPLAMWIASLIAAWIAAETQVLRPVRALRGSIIAFADGSRVVQPPDLSAAPNELRDVGDAYDRLMSSVIRDEAELEDSVHQKDVLLREVHHRVKNNLQLIASIMNLQMRKSVSPEARTLLKGLHDRVMSLATVHRELYQTSGLTDVQADELLASIVGQVVRMGAGADRQVETKTSFDRIRLTPDQAVPLSLILTEALTNALKHSGRTAESKTDLFVSLHHSGLGRAELRLANTLHGKGPVGLQSGLESTGLGHQLLTAFATQLAGQLTVGEEDGLYVVRLDFPVHDLSLREDADRESA